MVSMSPHSNKQPQPANRSLLEIPFDHTKDNVPNPDVLLPSLRFSGYTFETATGDLADNPLDHGADLIVISLEKVEDQWSLSVADNGSGMYEDTLDQMMRLGSRSEHDPTVDLGAFGLGATTASLSLGRLQHVITCPEPTSFLSAATDLDEIVKTKRFVKHIGVACRSELDLFREAFSRWGLDVPATGTLVRVDKIDNMGRSSVKPALDDLRLYVGRTYRHFIRAGKRFVVNGETIMAFDPLERDNSGTTILFDETFDYVYPKGHTRAGDTEQIGAIAVQLRDWGGPEANKEHGYTIDKSGFYIMRNRREIVPHSTLGLYARHNALSRFRCELLFPATMDQDLGVTFLKSAWDIKPSQSLRDKLRSELGPYVRQARRNYTNSLSDSSDEVPHAEAAKVIRQRSPFLRKPQTRIEVRQSPEHGDPRRDLNSEQTNRTRTPQDPRTQRALADVAEFRVKDLGLQAPFFDADLNGRKVVVTYNGQHPFYQRFILENRDNPSVIAGIDYLVYSLATAEMRAADDDTWKFLERMREDVSFNLRQLLTT